MEGIFLDVNTPAGKLLDGVGGEIGSLFLLACIGLAVWYFYQKAFTKFLGFIIFAMFVSVFVFAPENVKNLGETGFDWLFEAFLK